MESLGFSAFETLGTSASAGYCPSGWKSLRAPCREATGTYENTLLLTLMLLTAKEIKGVF